MKKCIIKNCPAFNDIPNMYDEIYGYCDNEHDIDLNKCMCENITDCVLKQIVELCKEIKCPCEYKGADCWECTESGARRFADRILQLLDIQEVE